MPRVVASIEARMNASRLPGKVLMDIGGRAALGRMLDRVRKCQTLDGIVIATTDRPADDAIAAWCRAEGVDCFRGSEDDVLARVAAAQAAMNSDVVVELCGDCPFSDPDVIDQGVATFLANEVDVLTTTQKQSYPAGIDVQVFRRAALQEVCDTIRDPALREHVSLYFYEHPERYRVIHLAAPSALHRPEMRLLLDYPEDLAMLRAVFDRLAPSVGPDFAAAAVVTLLDADPAIAAINANCVDKPVR